jgi:uncharacterized protein YfaS (alpha-2-macroglobulin family)
MRTRVFVTALLVLCCASSAPAQPGPRLKQRPSLKQRLKQQLQKLGGRGQDKRKLRGRLYALIKEAPRAIHCQEALLAVAQSYDARKPVELRAALKDLRDLCLLEPRGRLRHSMQLSIERLSGWQFARSGSRREPGRLSMRVRQRGRPASSLSVYRVKPADVETAALLGAELRDIPRRQWEALSIHAIQPIVPSAKSRPYRGEITVSVPKTPGCYLIEEMIDGFRSVQAVEVHHSQLVVHSLGGEVLAYMLDGVTGEPRSGVKITLQAVESGERAEGKTNAEGMLRLPCKSAARVVARVGDDVLACSVEVRSVKSEGVVYVTTDRPVYRPGQKVFFKAIYRKLGERLRLPGRTKVRVDVRDPLGRVLSQHDLTWSEQGTLSGELALAAEPALGVYSVLVHEPKPENDASRWGDNWERDLPNAWGKTFAVMAYRKPTAKISVEVTGPKKAGGLASAVLRAEYFHGGAVANAEVEWRVDEMWEGRYQSGGLLNARPPFEDPLGWLYEADNARSRSDDSEDYWDEGVLSGRGRTGADGTLRFSFPTRGGAWKSSYRIYADVNDDSRLSSSATSPTLVIEPSSLRLDVGTSRVFEDPGTPAEVGVRVRDSRGSPVARQEVTLVALLARAAFGDTVEFEGTSTFKGTTDSKGLVRFRVPTPRAGRLRLVARVTDRQGREAAARCGVWIAGDAAVQPSEDSQAYHCESCDRFYARAYPGGCLQCKTPLRLEHSALPSPELDLLGQQLAYRVGNKARFMIRAASVPLTCLLTVEGERILVSRVVRLTKRCTILELPVGPAWAPSTLVKLKTWRAHDTAGSGVRVAVTHGRADLSVSLASDRSTYAPGDKGQLVITTTRGGKPVAGEVEVAIIDERILQLIPDMTPDVRGFFSRLRSVEAHVASSGSVYDAWQRLEDHQERDVAYGGSFSFDDSGEEESEGMTFSGEALTELLEASSFAPARTRRRFPDTLIYRARLKLGSEGRVVLPLHMPDTLTRWRVVARAVSGAEGFGRATANFVTRQDVVLTLATPRFMVEGDKATVATLVQNRLGTSARFKVTLTATGARVVGAARTLEVAAGATARVDWEVAATEPGLASFKAQALSARASDAVERAVSVKAFGIHRVRLAAGEVLKDKWEASLVLPLGCDPRRATLELSVAAGPLAAIEQALPFLAGFPYGCVEQTMSRFLPAVVASGTLRRLGLRNARLEGDLPVMVSTGLQRLYAFQHEDDGGWGWWKHDETDPRMTAYVMFGLLRARAAGFKIDAEVLKLGLECLQSREATPFVLYVRALAGEKDGFEDELAEASADESLESVAYLVLAGRNDLAKRLPKAPPKTMRYSDVVQVSLVLRALVASVGRADPRVAVFTRWLLKHRRGFQWYTTLDTAHAILALSEVASGLKPAPPQLHVNGKPVPREWVKRGQVTLPPGWVKVGANSVRVSVKGGGYASARLRYLTQDDPIDEEDGPVLRVGRRLEIADGPGEEAKWKPLADGATVRRRSRVRVVVSVLALRDVSYVLIESPLPAGAEGWSGVEDEEEWWDDTWYQRREFRDDRVSVCASEMVAGKSEFIHHLRFTHPGTFRLLPARAEGMYDPVAVGTSGSMTLKVVD